MFLTISPIMSMLARAGGNSSPKGLGDTRLRTAALQSEHLEIKPLALWRLQK